MKDLVTSPQTDLESSFSLSQVSGKDKPWDIHRASADTVRNSYKQVGYERYAERMTECSRLLEFTFQREISTGELLLKLRNARFCRVRHCPVCQWRRSMMWRARFFQILPKLLEDHPKARFVFLTLTVRNCPLESLREVIEAMTKAWSRLVKRKQFPAIGWVKSLEVTRGKDGTAHPHFHIVLMVKSNYFSTRGGYLSQKRWTELWQSCLRADYTPVVNVKAVKSKRGFQDGIFVALCETLKYSVKEEDLKVSPQWLKELTNQLHKTRSIALGGVFKQYLSEEEPEDLIHTDIDESESFDENMTFIFGWRERYAKYMSQ